MATVRTNDLRVQNASNLMDSLNEGDASTYMFLGRPTPWPTGDNNPPVPTNNFSEFYRTYDQMLSLQKIANSDAYHLIPKRVWSSGIVYDIYRPDYSLELRAYSQASNLYDANFYALNRNGDVYVCLYNNSGPTNTPTISTEEPLATSDKPFQTGDGYIWLKLYSVANLGDYVTSDFMPVVPSASLGTVAGGIYSVVIEDMGTGYTNSPKDGPNQLDWYYCNIVGDGSGAKAKVKVVDNSISEVVVYKAGSGYTQATLEFSANKVFATKVDLNNNENALNPAGDGDFRCSVIVSPPEGWGHNLPRELGGTRVGIFSSLSSTNFDFISGNQFRQVGLIQDPDFVSPASKSNQTLSACFAIKCDPGDDPSGFDIGETIEQTVVDQFGNNRKAKGQVVNWDSDNNIVKYIQDPDMHKDEDDGVLYAFNSVVGLGISPVYVVGMTSNRAMTVQLDFTQTNAGLNFVGGYAIPEIEQYSGMMTYLSNMSPITRTETQNERISLIISY